MQTLKFSILINASREKVWNTMLQDATYRIWASEFHEGSCFEGSWEKGSEIHFLGPDEDGNMGGMYSRIKENVEHEFISIEHLGFISKGIIDTTSEEVKKWTPAFENYVLLPKENQTELLIEMETSPEYAPMFEEMWPRALESLKNLCEKYKETDMTEDIFPCLWFDGKAKAAAEFYCGIFKNSRILSENPMVVNFELNGKKFMGLNGGPMFKFNEAVSFVITCADQAEIDYYWTKLTENGEESMCGWLKDQFGVSWQVVPSILGSLMSDTTKAERVSNAFMQMRKMDIEKLINA